MRPVKHQTIWVCVCVFLKWKREVLSNQAPVFGSGAGTQAGKSAPKERLSQNGCAVILSEINWMAGIQGCCCLPGRASACPGSQTAMCQSQKARQLLHPGASLCSSAKEVTSHPPLTPSPFHSHLEENKKRNGWIGVKTRSQHCKLLSVIPRFLKKKNYGMSGLLPNFFHL